MYLCGLGTEDQKHVVYVCNNDNKRTARERILNRYWNLDVDIRAGNMVGTEQLETEVLAEEADENSTDQTD